VTEATTFVNAASKLVTAALQRKRNPGTLMRRGRGWEEKEPSQTKTKKAGRGAGPLSLTLR